MEHTVEKFKEDLEKYTVLKYQDNRAAGHGYVSGRESNLSTGAYRIFFNVEEDEFKSFGLYELPQAFRGTQAPDTFLENHFVNPVNPSAEELALWELEYGESYRLIPFLKEIPK